MSLHMRIRMKSRRAVKCGTTSMENGFNIVTQWNPRRLYTSVSVIMSHKTTAQWWYTAAAMKTLKCMSNAWVPVMLWVTSRNHMITVSPPTHSWIDEKKKKNWYKCGQVNKKYHLWTKMKRNLNPNHSHSFYFLVQPVNLMGKCSQLWQYEKKVNLKLIKNTMYFLLTQNLQKPISATE